MSGQRKREENEAGRVRVSVMLPAEMGKRLAEFCREMNVSPDLVVERALADYFREGDMSH